MLSQFQSFPSRPLRSVAPLLVVLLGLAGCGSKPPLVPEVDSEEAGVVLQEVLEGWQAGKTVDAFQKSDPPVVILDPDWGRGVKLTKFEISGSGKVEDGTLLSDVKLFLQEGGSESEQAVRYQVTTTPNLVVKRDIRQ
jgi:hypothetical protein